MGSQVSWHCPLTRDQGCPPGLDGLGGQPPWEEGPAAPSCPAPQPSAPLLPQALEGCQLFPFPHIACSLYNLSLDFFFPLCYSTASETPESKAFLSILVHFLKIRVTYFAGALRASGAEPWGGRSCPLYELPGSVPKRSFRTATAPHFQSRPPSYIQLGPAPSFC